MNAKQLERPALQAGPSRCESDHGRQNSAEFQVQSEELVMMSHGDSFCTLHSELSTAFGSQGVNSSARRSAKAEVRGASPRESATFLSAEWGVQSAELH